MERLIQCSRTTLSLSPFHLKRYVHNSLVYIMCTRILDVVVLYMFYVVSTIHRVKMKILVKMMLTVCSGTSEAMLPRKFMNIPYSLLRMGPRYSCDINTSIII